MINYGLETKVFRLYLLIIISLGSITLDYSKNAPKVQIISQPIIVIDPGHGGKDDGAHGQKSVEKDINLQVAIRLRTLIYSFFPNAKVILTREKDEYIELEDRTNIANAAKADLFISLHCNSNLNGGVRGAETYIMGIHKSEDNLWITAIENKKIGDQTDHETAFNFEPEDLIFLNQIQSQTQDKSIEFAELCHQGLMPFHPGGSRPLKQAGFLVLWQATMPAVLLELGYINNPKDEEFLRSSEGQIILSNSIAQSVKKYFEKRNDELLSSAIPYEK